MDLARLKIPDEDLLAPREEPNANHMAILHVELQLIIFKFVNSPLRLGAVCRAWRTTIWDDTQLWDTVELVVTEARHEAQIEILGEWLNRSGERPLFISLSSDPHPRDFDPSNLSMIEYLQSCLELLALESHRWDRFNLSAPNHLITTLFSNISHLPLLRCIVLYVAWYPGPNDNLESFPDAPLLREVNIGTRVMNEIKLPWHQLEKLMASWIEDDLCRLLRVAQNLTHLQFASCGRPAVIPPQRILLPRLRFLALVDCHESNPMDYLNLPALKYFSSDPEVDMAVLLRLIEHSSCRLLTLKIHIDRPNHDFLPLMSLLPSLVKLTLRVTMGYFPSYVMYALDPNMVDVVLLPNLIELLYVGYMTDFPFGKFIDMLATRWQRNGTNYSEKLKSVSRLRRVSLEFTSDTIVSDLADEHYERLRILSREGMEVKISIDGNPVYP